MEVDGMGPWKTTFLYKQVVLHFHVSELECIYFSPSVPDLVEALREVRTAEHVYLDED